MKRSTREILRDGGQNLDALEKAAARRDLRPVPLECSAWFDIDNALRHVESNNAVARIDGAHQVPKTTN